MKELEQLVDLLYDISGAQIGPQGSIEPGVYFNGRLYQPPIEHGRLFFVQTQVAHTRALVAVYSRWGLNRVFDCMSTVRTHVWVGQDYIHDHIIKVEYNFNAYDMNIDDVSRRAEEVFDSDVIPLIHPALAYAFGHDAIYQVFYEMPNSPFARPAQLMAYDTITDAQAFVGFSQGYYGQRPEEVHLPVVFLDEDENVEGRLNAVTRRVRLYATDCMTTCRIKVLENLRPEHQNNLGGLSVPYLDDGFDLESGIEEVMDAYFGSKT